jgi:transcriptional regulator with XRE-family HTH domain
MTESEFRPGLYNIDTLIGTRIRIRRLSLGIDQQTLGRTVGLTSQEIEACESGATRVRASQLSAMAETLDVPILFFFRDLKPEAGQARPEHRAPDEE